MFSTINSEIEEKPESDCESSLSNSSSNESSLSRHPSLAEISTIASNCSTTSMLRQENHVESNSEALNSEIASTEMSIVRLASQSSGIMMVPATPPKHAKKSDPSTTTSTSDEPLTPTANLKMLVSAASPAIRDRESKKRELFTEPEQTNRCVVPSFALPMFDSKVVFRNGNLVQVNLRDGSESAKMVISRKDKSLGLLCQRFLAKYPENPSPQQRIEISLDEVAKDLSVERRRIYDIVNVLESVEVISRFAKNRYMWHGKTRLPQTLAKLKHFAITHGISSKGGSSGKENPQTACQIKCTKVGTNSKLPHLLPKNTKISLPGMACLASIFDGEEDEMTAWAKKQREADYCRKDKSLGVLSQKFLMMFLLSETRQVTLDDAANLLIDEEEEGKAKYKTKVRRLYDIANILSSLQLIQKVHIHNIQSGRKPGFRWIGIDLDSLDKLSKVSGESANFPKKKASSSKNSLVAKEPLETEESAFGRLISRRPSQQQLRRTRSDGSNKSKLPRSRSDRGLACKKRVLCDEDYSTSNKEDGYSVQEITGLGEDTAMRSPDSAKFHSELMKLQEQYPDRMSQLLSACRQGLLPEDNKKSRRTLFTGDASLQDEGPTSKRRKSSDDVKQSESDNAKQFVHSSTSPFKPFQIEPFRVENTAGSPLSKKITPSAVEGSPEQKILLEREKQKKLLEEQKDFELKDERWKRIEDELEKALPKTRHVVPRNNSSIQKDRVHSSVGIQASLIDDVSPIKPLSNYVKNMKPWQPLSKEKLGNPSTALKSASPSPVSFQAMGISPLVSSPVNEASTSPTSATVGSTNNVQNMNLVSFTSSHLQSLWTLSTCSAQSSQAPVYLSMPNQNAYTPQVANPCTLSVTPSTSEPLKLVPSGVQQYGENCLGNIMQVTSSVIQPSTTLPMNVVGCLNNLLQDGFTGLKESPVIRPLVSLQSSVTQGFGPKMVMTSIQGIRSVRPPGATPNNQITPILPKGITPQNSFPSMLGETPCNNTAFVHSDIVKKLVMSDAKST